MYKDLKEPATFCTLVVRSCKYSLLVCFAASEKANRNFGLISTLQSTTACPHFEMPNMVTGFYDEIDYHQFSVKKFLTCT